VDVGSTQFAQMHTTPKNSRASRAAYLLILVLCGSALARTRETGAASFSIDLDKPYSEVLSMVEETARSGVIKGTFEYRGEEQLNNAEFADKSQLFPSWTQPGKVFYKIRAKALSPSHFLNSNDVGTVAVRYVVQEKGANSTRLFIDAVFVENARHHGHPSDGYVETCEFGEIGKLLKEREQLQKLAASDKPFISGTESTSHSADRQDEIKQTRAAHVATGASAVPPQTKPGSETKRSAPHMVVDANATSDLQQAIAEQKSLLVAERANLDKLEAQARKLRASEFLRIRAERAEIKASPYSHARVIEALTKGQEVTVLARSSYWYQVRSENGQEGWISHALLEGQP
jgi:Bacterial SH3 domain